MILFAVGEFIGRPTGIRFTRLSGALVAAITVNGAGCLLLWASPQIGLALVGLFVVGFGVANLFPSALSLAVGAAPERTDDATARARLVVGVAVMLAPLALGALADHIGVGRALTLQVLLLVLATALLTLSRGGWATRSRWIAGEQTVATRLT